MYKLCAQKNSEKYGPSEARPEGRRIARMNQEEKCEIKWRTFQLIQIFPY